MTIAQDRMPMSRGRLTNRNSGSAVFGAQPKLVSHGQAGLFGCSRLMGALAEHKHVPNTTIMIYKPAERAQSENGVAYCSWTYLKGSLRVCSMHLMSPGESWKARRMCRVFSKVCMVQSHLTQSGRSALPIAPTAPWDMAGARASIADRCRLLSCPMALPCHCSIGRLCCKGHCDCSTIMTARQASTLHKCLLNWSEGNVAKLQKLHLSAYLLQHLLLSAHLLQDLLLSLTAECYSYMWLISQCQSTLNAWQQHWTAANVLSHHRQCNILPVKLKMLLSMQSPGGFARASTACAALLR